METSKDLAFKLWKHTKEGVRTVQENLQKIMFMLMAHDI